MSGSWYDVAQICQNGHVVNNTVRKYPQHNKKFCDKCGAPTLTQCQSCNTEIQGEYHVDGVVSFSDYILPLFCHNCGKPYPWTEIRIKAAQELVQELDISGEDKQILVESISEIVKNTPRTSVSATNFKRIVSKAGIQVGIAFRDILVDIVSETAKKMIWPS